MQRVCMLHPQRIVLALGGHHIEEAAAPQELPLLQRGIAQLFAVLEHGAHPALSVEGGDRLLMDFAEPGYS